jgi:RNA polymerase primary sigma factor
LIVDLFEDTEKISWSDALSQLNRTLIDSTFKHKVLAFEEAKKLSEILHGTTDETEFEGELLDTNQARDILITRNLKLVRKIALSMRNSFKDVDIEDLCQSGTMGLIRAVEKWDPSREFQFSTYATWHIRQSITRFTLDNYSTIRIPIYLSDKLAKVKSYLVQYVDFFDCEPETLEAADALEISESEYLVCRNALFSFTSFETELEANRSFLERQNYRQESCELFIDPARSIELSLLSDELSNILDTLSEREAGVIALRFGLTNGCCYSLEEIGKVYGVTRERIRQIEAKTMSKLRNPARSQFLLDYLDFEEARWESKAIHTKDPYYSYPPEGDSEDHDSAGFVSHELYCGGW